MSAEDYEHTTSKNDAVGVAGFAKQYDEGDAITFEAPPDGEPITAEVVGFSTRMGVRGLPVVETPDAVLPYFDGAPETIAIEAEFHVPRGEAQR